jgi:hypothetical protein
MDSFGFRNWGADDSYESSPPTYNSNYEPVGFGAKPLRGSSASVYTSNKSDSYDFEIEDEEETAYR